MSTKNSSWLVWVVLLVGFGGVWKLQHQLDAQRAALHQEQNDLVLRSGAMLKMMSLEYAPLLADLYWTRAVQYYGDKHRRGDADIQLLWPLLDIATNLDPKLIVAYRFGSTFLSEAAPRGVGRPDLAIELINRGIKENPREWRLYEDLGFIYYFNLKDFTKASAAFLEGSKKPGAYIWMKALAAKVLEQGETRETSAFLWNDIYTSATNPEVKQNALTHLQLLRADLDCEQLTAVAAEYEKRTGKRPGSVRELINAGVLKSAPSDPLGFVYVFDSEGKAQLNPASPLYQQKPRYQRPL